MERFHFHVSMIVDSDRKEAVSMKQSRKIIPGQKYRHFKGKLYQIITLGYHSETNEEMVVYQALYGDFKVYIRPLYMFLEPVDTEKYPDAAQIYRFELVETEEEIEKDEGFTATEATDSKETSMDVNPLLIKFLDADTYTDKLKIYLEMRDSIDEVILADVAASLDIATGDGTLEEQYASVQYALHTLSRYERNSRE